MSSPVWKYFTASALHSAQTGMSLLASDAGSVDIPRKWMVQSTVTSCIVEMSDWGPLRRFMRRSATYLVLGSVFVFGLGFVSAILLLQRTERHQIADRTGTDLARLSEISGRLTSSDTNGAITIVRQEVFWRDAVLRNLWQQDPSAFKMILPTVQSTKRAFAYQNDPALAHALDWAPTLAVDDARRAFDDKILRPRALAPELSTTAWLGHAYTLSGLRGKAVLLDFWWTSCAPCIRGMPKLRSLQEEFGSRGLVILTIHGAQDPQSVDRFLQTNPIGLPVAMDDGQTFKRYGVHVFPTKALINRQGRVVWSPDGLDPSRNAMTEVEETAELRDEIAKALDQ
jgi:thiol-disulfide isomerase/thioredoxin